MKKYYNSINILRIIFAVFIACVAHYMIIMSGEYYNAAVGNEVLDITYIGVEIFFAVSGFFAYVSYIDKIRDKKYIFVSFLWGRIKRLYPAMIISVIIVAAAQWISYDKFGHYAILDYYDGRNSLMGFVLSILGVNCGWICNHDTYSINGVTWYISILMICYMLFYVYGVLYRKNKVIGYIFISALMVLGLIILIIKPAYPLLYLSNGRGYLDFFGGVLIAGIYTHIDKEKYKKHMIIIGIIMLVIYAILRVVVDRDNICYLCSFLFNPGIMLLFLNVDFLDKIADNKVMRYLGKISFDIYLFNMPVFAWIVLISLLIGIDVDYTNVGMWFLCTAINILFAMLISYLLDKATGVIKRKGKRSNGKE